MKTFEQFRSEWILNPSKEMIVESEIKIAYEKYASEAAEKVRQCGLQLKIYSFNAC